MALHQKERNALKLQKQQLENIFLLKLDENSNGLSNEIERLKNEIFRHIAQENAETTRLKNQESILKSENQILKQKVTGFLIKKKTIKFIYSYHHKIGLETRILDLEKNVGNIDRNFISEKFFEYKKDFY